MNNNRRILLNTAWTVPVITAIFLPAHAQMSICSMADLVGTWRFSFSTHFGESDFELFSDGTSDVFQSWEVINNSLIMSIDVTEYRFTAELSSNCDSLSGSSTSTLTFPPFNEPANGTWSAERTV